MLCRSPSGRARRRDSRALHRANAGAQRRQIGRSGAVRAARRKGRDGDSRLARVSRNRSEPTARRATTCSRPSSGWRSAPRPRLRLAVMRANPTLPRHSTTPSCRRPARASRAARHKSAPSEGRTERQIWRAVFRPDPAFGGIALVDRMATTSTARSLGARVRRVLGRGERHRGRGLRPREYGLRGRTRTSDRSSDTPARSLEPCPCT